MRFSLPPLRWLDLVDIAIVAFLLYQLFLMIRETRAVQILQGLAILFVAKMLSYYLKLDTIFWILNYAIVGIAVAIPIVFQPELRRALERIGRGGVLGSALSKLGKEDLTRLIDEIAWATTILSQTKTGALIVIERETGLQDFIERGTRVEGEVSSKLLLSIFMPKSPLHDGAVMIRGNRVASAGSYLPLSDSPFVESGLGTRHRAAVGITEETDAIAVVVSEETGGITVSREGKLLRDLDEDHLKKLLMADFVPPSRRPVALWSIHRGGKYGDPRSGSHQEKSQP